MTYPGHPTQLSGKVAITGGVDGVTSANIIQDLAGDKVGLYLDDTTPNLARVWLPKAVQMCKATGMRLLVAVATNQLGMHYQPSIAHGGPIENMIEAYAWGMDEPWRQIPWPSKNEYQHVIIQKDWPGPLGHRPPPPDVYAAFLKHAIETVDGDHDRVWLF